MPDWTEVLNEFSNEAYDTVSHKYLDQLHQHTKRNIIVYCAGWQIKPDIDSSITDYDCDGFMQMLDDLDYSKGLDLILHTPGGDVSAVQNIISHLLEKFNSDIRAIIPHTAMSGGTVISICCKNIIMAKHSCIRPIDPYISGVSAQRIIREYEEICKETSKNFFWDCVADKYTPELLDECREALKANKAFAIEGLKHNMLKASDDKESKAKKIVDALTEKGLSSHSTPIRYDNAKELGLDITLLEEDDDLQDLVMTVYHCCTHTIENTSAYKIIQNHTGARFIRIQ